LQKNPVLEKALYFLEHGQANGKLDFGLRLCEAGYNNAIFLAFGKGYNVADFGNFSIGFAAGKAKIPLFVMKAGAQYNHIKSGKSDVNECYQYLNPDSTKKTYSPGLFDSPEDLNAIEDGYGYGNLY
jgi:hypothetical protein